MHFEVALERRPEGAEGAGEGLLSCVYAQVAPQVGGGAARVATDGARVDPAGVAPVVGGSAAEGSGVAPVAGSAAEGSGGAASREWMLSQCIAALEAGEQARFQTGCDREGMRYDLT